MLYWYNTLERWSQLTQIEESEIKQLIVKRRRLARVYATNLSDQPCKNVFSSQDWIKNPKEIPSPNLDQWRETGRAECPCPRFVSAKISIYVPVPSLPIFFRRRIFVWRRLCSMFFLSRPNWKKGPSGRLSKKTNNKFMICLHFRSHYGWSHCVWLLASSLSWIQNQCFVTINILNIWYLINQIWFFDAVRRKLSCTFKVCFPS